MTRHPHLLLCGLVVLGGGCSAFDLTNAESGDADGPADTDAGSDSDTGLDLSGTSWGLSGTLVVTAEGDLDRERSRLVLEARGDLFDCAVPAALATARPGEAPEDGATWAGWWTLEVLPGETEAPPDTGDTGDSDGPGDTGGPGDTSDSDGPGDTGDTDGPGDTDDTGDTGDTGDTDTDAPGDTDTGLGHTGAGDTDDTGDTGNTGDSDADDTGAADTDGPLDCEWPGPRTFEVGFGVADPALQAAADPLGLSATTSYGLHVQPPQRPLWLIGVAGTQAQLDGRATADPEAVTPGTYTLHTLHGMPLGRP